MSQQRVLDHPGVDVVAAADDQVLGPPGQVHQAAVVHLAEVAGVQPAVSHDAVPADPGAAESGVGDISGEYRGPPMTSTPVWPGPQSVQDPSAPVVTTLISCPGRARPTDPGRSSPGLVQVVAQVASVSP